MRESATSDRPGRTPLGALLAAILLFFVVPPTMIYLALRWRNETVVGRLPAGTLVSVAYQSELLREQTLVTTTSGAFLVRHAFPGARGQALVLEGRESGELYLCEPQLHYCAALKD